MSKTFKNQLNDIFKDLSSNAKKGEKKMMKSIAYKSLNLVKNRIISGFGVDDNGDKKRRFKALKASTIKARKKKKLDSNASPSKSNQIESGEYINSLKTKIKGSTVEIKPSAKSEKYMKHQSKDRASLNLSAKEIDEVMLEVDKWLDDIIK